jgi:hypothetical protein
MERIQIFIRNHPFLIVAGIIILSVGGYLWNFHDGISDSNSDWGTFGDFFNGVSGPLIGIIGVVLTYTIINNQTRESNQSEFKFIFELLFNATEREIEKIHFKKGRKTFQGRKAIEMMNHEIKGLVKFSIEKGNIPKITEAVKHCFTATRKDANYSFSTYINNIHNTLKAIDSNCNEEHKRTYATLLRMNMDTNQIIFLLYNGLGNSDYTEFKQLLQKFTILQAIQGDARVDSAIKDLYETKAFKE